MPHRFVVNYLCFGTTNRLHLQGSIHFMLRVQLKVEPAHSCIVIESHSNQWPARSHSGTTRRRADDINCLRPMTPPAL